MRLAFILPKRNISATFISFENNVDSDLGGKTDVQMSTILLYYAVLDDHMSSDQTRNVLIPK